MNRLTKRDEFGNADIIGVESADLQENLEYTEFNMVTNALNRLAEYEELEVEGKMIRLPCSEGTTVYVLELDDEKMDHFFCPVKVSEYEFEVSLLPLFGKCVFLTREEADAELAKREEK